MEADDVLGHDQSGKRSKWGLDVHIATGDRDILQLLGPHVRVQLPQRGERRQGLGCACVSPEMGALSRANWWTSRL